MKYRHAFHAGNFADVHKHAALLALLGALTRKAKGFLYLETHAGRGAYDLGEEGGRDGLVGAERFLSQPCAAEELQRLARAIGEFRVAQRRPHAYPGSPLFAAGELRPQDRAVLIERQALEAQALQRALHGHPGVRIQCGDGYELLRSHLPPRERRGLLLIDPPYEERRRDFERVAGAIGEALRRFPTGVIAAWYPIKDERDTAAWLASLAAKIDVEALVSELWLHPRDSRVALNGSGVLVVNPPYRIAERMQLWLPELHALLDSGAGGASVRPL